jgi:hypothetical protein
MIKGEF